MVDLRYKYNYNILGSKAGILIEPDRFNSFLISTGIQNGTRAEG